MGKPVARAWGYALVGAGFLLATAPFLHTQGFGEPDSTAIGAGLLQGLLTGEGLAWPSLYGLRFSFAYYLAAFPLLRLLGLSPTGVILALNLSHLLTGLAAVLLLLALLARFLPLPWAGLAALGFFLTPATWQLWTSSHPFGLALLSCLAALLALDTALRAHTGRPALWALGGTLLLAFTLGCRPDVALLLPAYAGLLLYRRELSWRPLALLSLSGLGAFLLFALVGEWALAGPVGTAPTREMARLTGEFWSAGALLRGAAISTAAAGVGLCLLLAGGLAWTLGRRDWRTLGACALWLAPSLLCWLGNPLPVRHFFLAAAGIGAWAVLLLRPRLPARSVALLLLPAGLLTLAVPTAARLLAGGRQDTGPPHHPLFYHALESQLLDLHHWRHWQPRWQRFEARAPARVLLVGTWEDYTELVLYQGMRHRPCRVTKVRVGGQPLVRVAMPGRTVLWLESYGPGETASGLARVGTSWPVVIARPHLAPAGPPASRLVLRLPR